MGIVFRILDEQHAKHGAWFRHSVVSNSPPVGADMD
jgi:hypothetical protein